MSIRKKFISLTSPFTRALPLSALTALTGQDFIIPFYHIVSDGDCPHVKNLYRFKTVKEFESDLDYLTKHYQPIAATDMPDVLAGKYKGKKIMLLTFDDGLREMYDVVAPILLRKGIPAVLFLNNDFIDNKALMFRYKVSLVLGMDKPIDLYEIVQSSGDKDVMMEVEGMITTEFDDFLRDYKPYMTSDQIRSLMSQGFTIGAHSCSHPYYSKLSLDAQMAETLGSINGLQKEFGLKQRLFAFPFTDDGVSKAFFDKVFNEGQVDFTFGGAGIKNDVHPRQFQRIPMEGWNASAEQTLKSEYLYYLLRMPFGKNTIKRQ
jgi:peptidoglycan/xylan/chitin deacetylase (PgdA/CDA1 family)